MGYSCLFFKLRLLRQKPQARPNIAGWSLPVPDMPGQIAGTIQAFFTMRAFQWQCLTCKDSNKDELRTVEKIASIFQLVPTYLNVTIQWELFHGFSSWNGKNLHKWSPFLYLIWLQLQIHQHKINFFVFVFGFVTYLIIFELRKI